MKLIIKKKNSIYWNIQGMPKIQYKGDKLQPRRDYKNIFPSLVKNLTTQQILQQTSIISVHPQKEYY